MSNFQASHSSVGVIDNILNGEDSEQLNVNRDWLNNKKPFINGNEKRSRPPQKSIGLNKNTSSEFSFPKNEKLEKFSIKTALQDPKKRKIIVYVIQSSFAVLVFIIVMLIVVVVNPPFLQKKNSSGWATGKPSGLLAAIVGLIAAALMFSICEFVRYYKF